MSRVSFPARHADEIPPELARQLDQSAEDLENDRTSDVGEFLAEMQAKLDEPSEEAPRQEALSPASLEEFKRALHFYDPTDPFCSSRLATSSRDFCAKRGTTLIDGWLPPLRKPSSGLKPIR